MESIQKSFRIYLLTPNATLPRHFLQASQTFAKFNLNIIPIDLDQLKKLKVIPSNSHVLYMESQFSEKDWLRKKVMPYLNFIIKAKKIHFYHLTSFKEFEEFMSYSRSGHYTPIQLPIRTKELVGKIVTNFYDSYKQETWPGGKRAKLPESAA